MYTVNFHNPTLVKAAMEGRKRRHTILAGLPNNYDPEEHSLPMRWKNGNAKFDLRPVPITKGEEILLRESFVENPFGEGILYAADATPEVNKTIRWTSSVNMPKHYARHKVSIKSVGMFKLWDYLLHSRGSEIGAEGIDLDEMFDKLRSHILFSSKGSSKHPHHKEAIQQTIERNRYELMSRFEEKLKRSPSLPPIRDDFHYDLIADFALYWQTINGSKTVHIGAPKYSASFLNNPWIISYSFDLIKLNDKEREELRLESAW